MQITWVDIMAISGYYSHFYQSKMLFDFDVLLLCRAQKSENV